MSPFNFRLRERVQAFRRNQRGREPLTCGFVSGTFWRTRAGRPASNRRALIPKKEHGPVLTYRKGRVAERPNARFWQGT